MNILSFDIEEWSVEKEFYGDRKEEYLKFDHLLDLILEKLNHLSLTATFFCVGKMAEDFPYVVKKISNEGHEIGNHSYSHRWINKMTREEFVEDTKKSVGFLEDLTGKKIKSFRAPAFSVGENNKWALEVLVENGIENDASIFPGARDFGGFPNFKAQSPCIINFNGVEMNEFPIPLFHLPVIGKEVAFSGGGYFRLLPYQFVSSLFRNREYNMCYFHIKDLLIEKSPLLSKKTYEDYFKETGTLIKRAGRYFKSNVGRKQALKNLLRLLNSFEFTSIERYMQETPSLERVVLN